MSINTLAVCQTWWKHFFARQFKNKALYEWYCFAFSRQFAEENRVWKWRNFN